MDGRKFGDEDVESIKRHQYEAYAETAFIREYSELRWLLNAIDLGSRHRLENYAESETGATVASNEDYVRQKLDEMQAVYPEDDGRHDGMKTLYLRWDDTVRLMLDQSAEYSRIAEFLDDFIFVLSRVVLRFDYGRHISAERLSSWETDAADVKSEFATQLRETRRELLDERDRSGELERISDAYSRTVDTKIQQLRSR